ncbi:MAG: hypothetical protein KIS92_11260 [Planctomycetota bacterium]|nr:hypothetical protein [Planctomycetota bacterium]
MITWDNLAEDWSEYHPNARQLLDDPFYWDSCHDFSPHGNSTGADLLELYRPWLKQHPHGEPLNFYLDLLGVWGILGAEKTTLTGEIEDEAMVALAFAEIKLRGICEPTISNMAQAALQRQRQKAIAAVDWKHREERLKRLAQFAEKLKSFDKS